MKKLLKPQGDFFKNTLSLAFGVGLSHTITFFSSLYLTHLYDPKDFGVFALYSALYSLISVFTTGRYALAISFSKNDKEAINLFALSLSIAILLCLLMLTFFYILPKDFFIFSFITTDIQQNFGLLIMGAFTNSIIQIFTPWLNRRKKFRDLYLMNIIQSSTIALFAITLGVFHEKNLGLIYSFLFGQSASVCFLIFKNKEERKNLQLINVNQMKKLGYKFIKFPLYSIFSDFFNNFSVNLPIFLLTKFYGESVVGFYSLAMRILGVPNTLLASSIAEVFKQRAVEDNKKYGNCKYIYIKTLYYLTAVGLMILFFTFILSPYAFPLLFGEEWIPSGQYAQILAFLYFIKFIISPLSVTLYIKNKQNVDLYFHILLLIMVFLVMWGLHTLGFSALGVISGMVVMFVLVYGIYLYKSYQYSY